MPEFGGNVAFAGAHKPHGDAQEATGHAEVGVLPACASAAMVFELIGGAMQARGRSYEMMFRDQRAEERGRKKDH